MQGASCFVIPEPSIWPLDLLTGNCWLDLCKGCMYIYSILPGQHMHNRPSVQTFFDVGMGRIHKLWCGHRLHQIIPLLSYIYLEFCLWSNHIIIAECCVHTAYIRFYLHIKEWHWVNSHNCMHMHTLSLSTSTSLPPLTPPPSPPPPPPHPHTHVQCFVEPGVHGSD